MTNTVDKKAANAAVTKALKGATGDTERCNAAVIATFLHAQQHGDVTPANKLAVGLHEIGREDDAGFVRTILCHYAPIKASKPQDAPKSAPKVLGFVKPRKGENPVWKDGLAEDIRSAHNSFRALARSLRGEKSKAKATPAESVEATAERLENWIAEGGKLETYPADVHNNIRQAVAKLRKAAHWGKAHEARDVSEDEGEPEAAAA